MNARDAVMMAMLVATGACGGGGGASNHPDAAQESPAAASPQPAPMLASVWPSSPAPGAAVLLTGLNLQAVDHLELASTRLPAQDTTTTATYVVALLPANTKVGTTTLVAVSKSGARSTLPLEVVAAPPIGPAGPLKGVAPRNPGLAGFNSPDLSNDWHNVFDASDSRYLFVQEQPADAQGATFTSVEGADIVISGAYDRSKGLVHLTMGPAATPSLEEYSGVFTDTNFAKCMRMMLFPRLRGHQLLIQAGEECPASSAGASCSRIDECRSGTACVSGRCLGTRALRFSLTFTADTNLDLSVTTHGGIAIDRLAVPPDSLQGGFLDEDQCVEPCPAGTHTENVIFPEVAPAGDFTIRVSNTDLRARAATFVVTVTDETNRVLKTFPGSVDEALSTATFTFSPPP